MNCFEFNSSKVRNLYINKWLHFDFAESHTYGRTLDSCWPTFFFVTLYFNSAFFNILEAKKTTYSLPSSSFWPRIAPKAYWDASVYKIKALIRSGNLRIGWLRSNSLSVSKLILNFSFHSNLLSFFNKSVKGFGNFWNIFYESSIEIAYTEKCLEILNINGLWSILYLNNIFFKFYYTQLRVPKFLLSLKKK